MTLKSGLRALALGVAMCGAASAEATTFSVSPDVIRGGGGGVYSDEVRVAFSSQGDTGDILDVHLLSYVSPPVDTPDDSFEIYSSQLGVFITGRMGDGSVRTLLEHTMSGSTARPDLGAAADRLLVSLDGVLGLHLAITFSTNVPAEEKHSEGWEFAADLPARLGAFVAPAPDPTPLPGALALFGSVLGIGGFAAWRKRAQRDAVATAA